MPNGDWPIGTVVATVFVARSMTMTMTMTELVGGLAAYAKPATASTAIPKGLVPPPTGMMAVTALVAPSITETVLRCGC